jgi:adenosylmethionine-8-amino-7-oxononanoate aminotransferase
VNELAEHLLVDFCQMKDFSQDPLILTDGHGIEVVDAAGRTYIDGLSGIFVVNAGHGNQRIIEAMKSQLDRLTFSPPLQATNNPALELTGLLLEIAPAGVSTVKLLSGGSEATETAMKMVRQYHYQAGHPRKHKIIARYLAYHGMTLGALSAGGVAKNKVPFEPLGNGFVHVAPPYCYRCPYNQTYPSCNLLCVTMIDRFIEWEGEDSVAAVIVEPIQVAAGVLTPPPGYFSQLRDICSRRNVALIFDEVITGFGRLGKMFAADLYEVVPDIICCAKGISSGYMPLAAVLVQPNIAETFWGERSQNVEFRHGHTFGGQPLACAAGVANIKEIIDRRLCENAAIMGAYLRERALAWHKYPLVGDVRGEGLLVGVELVRDRESKERFGSDVAAGELIREAARKRGLLIRGTPHYIAIAPPLIVTRSDIDAICDRVEDSLSEVSEMLFAKS